MLKKMLSAAVLATAISSSAADAALIALYKFDDAAALGLDSSGNGKNATNSGALFDAAGYQGGAAQFQFDAFLDAPINATQAGLPMMTWGAWVKPFVGGAAIQTVLSTDNGGFDRQIGLDSRNGGNGWSTFTGSGVLNSNTSPSTNEWTFLAAVYDQSASNVTFYVNGQSLSAGTSFGGANTFFSIGRNPDFGQHFSGLIDNVFVYDEALSAAQIAELRATGFPSMGEAVPEPATWALMLAGFGLVGAGVRRHRATVAFA